MKFPRDKQQKKVGQDEEKGEELGIQKDAGRQ